MKTVHIPAQTVPVIAETDVLVVGSGPGGLSAAISSARAGVDTMLIERYGCFGGNLTHVGVEGIAWYRRPETVDVEGIGLEFEQRAKAQQASYDEPQSISQGINAELFKVLADNWVQEAGIQPLLHATVVDVLRDGHKVTGVIVQSKAGRHAILAQRIVDATGDADVACLAGVPVRQTPKEEMMAVTVMFSCSGVDKARFLEYVRENPMRYMDWGKEWAIQTDGKEDDLFSPYLDEPFEKARASGLIPPGLKSIGGTWSGISDAGDATYLNMVHMTGYDGTDVWDLTRAEMEGRRQAMLAVRALQQFAPGFEKAGLRNFGMTLGIRDTRKIIGRYNLTEQDVRQQARFEDAVGIFPEFIDGYGVLILPTTGRYFHVPYGALVPQGVDNLLVAGRAIAGDKISHASVRNMMCCTVTGQGAGVAAAMSVKEGVTTADIHIHSIQAELKRQGVRFS
ncbi:MAG: FAD-dependent oxidoreductase [Ardenticatenaceae bacterium]|nr:FAD-dependent oxidoreductase [Ardenticatenaceae bacterium]